MINGEDKIKYDEAWKYCRNYINENAIYRVAPWERPLPARGGGCFDSWLFYMRRALSNPLFSMMISSMFWIIFEDEFKNTPFQLGACETAGTPIACYIQQTGYLMGLNVNVFYIRKDRKNYGLYNFTEGIIDPDIPILLVDDVGASHNTLINNQYIVERLGYKMYDKYFVLMEKIHNAHSENKLIDKKLISLFTTDDFDLSWVDYVDSNGHTPSFRSQV